MTDLLESNKQDNNGQYANNVVISLTQTILENDTLQEECAICLGTINKDDLAVTPCHHLFCKTCLDAALKANSTKCPLCTEKISKDKLICRQVKGENEYSRVRDLKDILSAAMDGKCSSKMTSVFEELDLIWQSDPDSKVLIFSQYLGMLNLMQTQLDERCIKFFRLDGSMSLNERRKTLLSFNSASSKEDEKVKRGCVLLASMKACGLGMNLTSASSVFILDPWW